MNYCNNYYQLKQIKRITNRDLFRKKILDVVSFSLNPIFSNLYIKKPRIQFLYIHHLFADEIVALHDLIANLAIHHTFISYSEAVQKVKYGQIDKPYIVFSSDDGLKNNLVFATILKSYGISACFFINPTIVGEKDYYKVKEYCASKLNFPAVEFMDWNDIESIQKHGHEIGSHTMSHMRISMENNCSISEDFENSFKIINDKCGEIKHFAYPYGRFSDFTERARELCFLNKFESCATAERGIHLPFDSKIEISQPILLRDHIILGWPISHSMFFIVKNAFQNKTLPKEFKFPNA